MHDAKGKPNAEAEHRVLLFPKAQGADQKAVLRTLESCGARVQHRFPLLGGLCVKLTPDSLAEAVKRHPDIYVLPDRRRRLPPVPFRRDEIRDLPASHNGPAGPAPTAPRIAPLALELMAVPAARRFGVDGRGVRVAIIDSGQALGLPTPVAPRGGKPWNRCRPWTRTA